MKIETKYLFYAFPTVLIALAGVYHAASFAYAACVALALVFGKEYFDRSLETKTVKTDDVLRHKVEQMEAALSAMVTRERARGF